MNAARGGLPPAPWQGALFLFAAILSEVLACTFAKLANGNKWWMAGSYAGYGACFALLPIAFSHCPLTLAYATWSGTGTTVIALISVFFFKEPMGAARWLSLALIVSGVIGMQVA